MKNTKKNLKVQTAMLVLAFSLQPSAFSQQHVTVLTDTNGNLAAGWTNLFLQNSNLLYQAGVLLGFTSGGGGGSPQSPWTTDENAAGHQLTNASAGIFQTTVSAPTSAFNNATITNNLNVTNLGTFGGINDIGDFDFYGTGYAYGGGWQGYSDAGGTLSTWNLLANGTGQFTSAQITNTATIGTVHAATAVFNTLATTNSASVLGSLLVSGMSYFTNFVESLGAGGGFFSGDRNGSNNLSGLWQMNWTGRLWNTTLGDILTWNTNGIVTLLFPLHAQAGLSVTGGGTTNNGTGFYGNGAGLTNLNASSLASGTVPTNIIPDLTGSTNLNHFALTPIPQINEQFKETGSGLPTGWTYSIYGGATPAPARNGSGLLLTNSLGYPASQWVYCASNYNGAHNFHIHVDFAVKQTNGVADGFMVGTKSGNPADDTSWAIYAYLLPNAYCGTLAMLTGPSTNLYANRAGDSDTGSGNVYPQSCALGTFFGLDIQVDDDTVNASISNKTTGQMGFFAWKQDVSTSSATNGYFGSSGNFGMSVFGGSFLVTNFAVNLTMPKKTDVLIWGDSIAGTGARASDFESGWSYKIRQEFAAEGLSAVIYGYSSETSASASNEVTQAVLLNPGLVLFANGGNDIQIGNSSYVTNLPGIAAAFPSSKMVWVAPSARSAVDESPLAMWMATNQPAAYIDVFDGTKFSESVNTLGLYANAYDTIHPGNEGYVAIYAIVRNWLRQNGYALP